MDWAGFVLTLALKIGMKFAFNVVGLPMLGVAMDVFEAGRCFYKGEVRSGLISSVSVVVDLSSLKLVGATKEAMKESAKGAVVQSAKDTAKSAAKEASRKVGQGLGKQIATGAIKDGKDAAIKMAKVLAKSASKEATRKVGQQVRKELAKGVTTEAVEEVFQAGTKTMFNKFLQCFAKGGSEVWDIFLDTHVELIFEALRQNPKEIAFELTKVAAKKGAEEEFKKHIVQLMLKDVVVSSLKATKRFSEGEN